MNFMYYLLLISAIGSITYGVKVNVQGSVSFGKDVLDTLGMYVGLKDPIARRLVPFSVETDTLYLITKYAYLCRDLPFCEEDYENVLNEYITILTKSVESGLKFLPNESSAETKSNKKHIFEDSLHKLLREIRKLLRAANMITREKTEHYLWNDVVKRICAMFQESAIEYATEKLGNDSEVTGEIKNKITQKIVIATTTVESIFEKKLCIDHAICSKSHECTKSLNILFGTLSNLNLNKTKLFIKYFSVALLDANFYSYVDESVANGLQIKFDDLAFSENVPIQELFIYLHRTIENILNSLKINTYYVGGKYMELVHIILSDMDHLYEGEKLDPFHVFLSDFFDWIRSGKVIKKSIRQVMADIARHILEAPKSLQLKLIRAVRVYLELTLESEY